MSRTQLLILSSLSSVMMLFLSACIPAENSLIGNQNIQVQIPVSDTKIVSGTAEIDYTLKVVTLENVYSTTELQGQFAKFFYAPSSTEKSLTGLNPLSFFLKTAANIYIPKNENTAFMATIYYHIQNLKKMSDLAGFVQEKKPLSIGLATQVIDPEMKTNRAFYDGNRDSILIVPYTKSELPIAVNSGILAHEYFHSLFFKTVLQKAQTSGNKKLSESLQLHLSEAKKLFEIETLEDASMTVEQLSSRIYLNSLNEGLADFWAWLYTKDSNFLKWSLSEFSEDRRLNVKPEVREYRNFQGSIYENGTQFARLLKSIADGLDEPQIMTTVIKEFLVQLSSEFVELKSEETLNTGSLYLFLGQSDKIKLDQNNCEVLNKNIIQMQNEKTYSCEKQADGSYKLKKSNEI